MKVAFLSVFPPFRGGISQFSSALYHALSKKTDIKAYNFKRQYPKILFPGKSQYRVDKKQLAGGETKAMLDSVDPRSFFKTARDINAFEPDLLLTSFWLPFFGPSLGSVAKRMKEGCKTVSILHNVIPHEKRLLDRSLTTRFLSRNDGFVVMSDQVRKDLLHLKPGAKHMQRIHPFYSHFGDKLNKEVAQKQLNIPSDKKVLLFFGIIRKYKGLDILLKAFKKLDNSYHLIIAGENYESMAPYYTLMEEDDIKNRISLFNEFIPENKVNIYFSAADLVVLPYRNATQSGITAVAYHFNVPVVATDVGGLKETVINRKTGKLVNRADPDELARGIQSLFPIPAHFNEEIEALKAEHSWELFADDLISFVRSLDS
ncbi:MAG: glycosyltransferase [Flavobacteriales bacterium]|nr:glycosyltransferase [Flavobacteriales bacterium]